jgi:hypothetical protein
MDEFSGLKAERMSGLLLKVTHDLCWRNVLLRNALSYILRCHVSEYRNIVTELN